MTNFDHNSVNFSLLICCLLQLINLIAERQLSKPEIPVIKNLTLLCAGVESYHYTTSNGKIASEVIFYLVNSNVSEAMVNKLIATQT